MSGETFKSPHGYDLATYEWIPEGDVSFLVYLMHGYAEYNHKFYLVRNLNSVLLSVYDPPISVAVDQSFQIPRWRRIRPRPFRPWRIRPVREIRPEPLSTLIFPRVRRRRHRTNRDYQAKIS